MSPTQENSLPDLDRLAEKGPTGDAADLDNLSLAGMRRLVQDLQARQAGLAQQNETLRQAQAELENTRRRYQELYDFAPVGYLTLDRKGNIREANLTAAAMLGVTQAALLNSRLDYYVTGKDLEALFSFRHAGWKPGERRSCEILLVPQGAAPFTARLVGSIVPGAEQPAGGLRLAFSDISAAKAAQEAALASETRYQRVLEAANEGIWLVNSQGVITYSNQCAADILGYAVTDTVGRSLLDFLFTEDRSVMTQRVAAWQQEDKKVRTEGRARHRSGSEVWLTISASPIIEQGVFWGTLVMFADITGQKRAQVALAGAKETLEQGVAERTARLRAEVIWRERAQEELRKSETKYRIVADNTYDWEYWLDASGRFVYCSPSCQRISGYAPGDFLSDFGLLYKIILPEDLNKFNTHQFETGLYHHPGELEYRIVRPDGTVRWIGHVCQPVFDERGRYAGRRGSNRDITAHKQADDALRQSEERFRVALKNSPVVVFNQDRDLRYTWVYNPHPGFDPMAIIGKNDADLFPEDDVARLVEVKRRVLETGSGGRTEVRTTINGQPVFFDLTVEPLRSPAGEIIGVTCAAADVTAHKQVEEALTVSLVKYQTLFDNLPLGITVSDANGRILESNRQAEHLLGLAPGEQVHWQIDGPEWRIIRPDGSPMPAEEYASVRALQEQRLVENVEMGLVKDGGLVTWINVTAAPIPLPGYGVAIVYSDISARRRAEQLLRATLASIGDGFFACDADWRFVYVNAAAERILPAGRRWPAWRCRAGCPGGANAGLRGDGR